MRQNLLGTNLLNISLYNAQHGHPVSQRGPVAHPGAQHLQYTMADQYPPMDYNMNQYHHEHGENQIYPGGQMGMEQDMYRLPPIDGMLYGSETSMWGGNAGQGSEGVGMGMEYGWDNQGMMGNQVEYGSGMGDLDLRQHHFQDAYYPSSSQEGYDHFGQSIMPDYQLPPIDPSHHFQARKEVQPLPPPIVTWANEPQQTPSGHVMFNERLFDGALPSAGMQPEAEGLAAFDEAVAEAGDIPSW
jgi:hypothetical protein